MPTENPLSQVGQLHRRYQREFWPAIAAYVLIMFSLWPLLPQVQSRLLATVLALLPVAPVLFVVRAMVRLVRGSDELDRQIHLIGLALTTTVLSTLSLAGGFLAAAGSIKLDGVILIWIWPALVVRYAFGRGWASRRYGGGGDVLCSNGVAAHRRLLLIAVLLGAVAWLGRYPLRDYQLGMLCGISVALAARGILLVFLRWRRRQHGDREARDAGSMHGPGACP
jgi:hypothetical protein